MQDLVSAIFQHLKQRLPHINISTYNCSKIVNGMAVESLGIKIRFTEEYLDISLDTTMSQIKVNHHNKLPADVAWTVENLQPKSMIHIDLNDPNSLELLIEYITKRA